MKSVSLFALLLTVCGAVSADVEIATTPEIAAEVAAIQEAEVVAPAPAVEKEVKKELEVEAAEVEV